jgi:hypothetical protein
MSQILEEVLTSAVGFIIAMVILTTAVVIGLYGYWTYTNHVTLQNYLWPIAEVVPYKGGYYLGVVNTGYEPFTIKQIYLSGGSTISANTKSLTHNQWFTKALNSLPVAVRVCSAIEPSVCVVAPVHGWSMDEIGVPPDAILVVVNGSGDCGWSLTWYGWSGGTISYDKDITFLIQPVYGDVHFILNNLLGPSEASPGSVVVFNVNCPSNNGLPPWLW